MKKSLLCIGVLCALSAAAFAQPPATNKPQEPISFFITSTGIGKGADLGGLSGADAHCQQLAEAVGSKKTWHAYLSTQAAGGKAAVNARDRIGKGPWFAANGQQVAKDVGDLHGDTLDTARLGNNLSKRTGLNERGEPIKASGETPNQHDILTGSQSDGRAFADAADRTCKNFTSSAADGAAQIGHFDRQGGGNVSWNSAHATKGCSQENLVGTGGAGLFYCFAIN